MTDDSGNATPTSQVYEPYISGMTEPATDYHGIAANNDNILASPRVKLAYEDAILISTNRSGKTDHELLFTKKEYRNHAVEFLDEHTGEPLLIGTGQRTLPKSLEANSWIPDPNDSDNTLKGHHYYGVALSEKDMKKVAPTLNRFNLIAPENRLKAADGVDAYNTLAKHTASSDLERS